MLIFIPEETRQNKNAVLKYIKCIDVTVIFVIYFIFACIVYCVLIIVMQNKVNAIQQYIVSSSLYLSSFVHVQPHVLPINKSESTYDNSVSVEILPVFENAQSAHLSVQVIADIDSKDGNSFNKGI